MGTFPPATTWSKHTTHVSLFALQIEITDSYASPDVSVNVMLSLGGQQDVLFAAQEAYVCARYFFTVHLWARPYV